MPDAAFDNSILTPSPLPTTSASLLPPTVGQSDFQNALERAGRPADPQSQYRAPDDSDRSIQRRDDDSAGDRPSPSPPSSPPPRISQKLPTTRKRDSKKTDGDDPKTPAPQREPLRPKRNQPDNQNSAGDKNDSSTSDGSPAQTTDPSAQQSNLDVKVPVVANPEDATAELTEKPCVAQSATNPDASVAEMKAQIAATQLPASQSGDGAGVARDVADTASETEKPVGTKQPGDTNSDQAIAEAIASAAGEAQSKAIALSQATSAQQSIPRTTTTTDLQTTSPTSQAISEEVAKQTADSVPATTNSTNKPEKRSKTPDPGESILEPSSVEIQTVAASTQLVNPAASTVSSGETDSTSSPDSTKWKGRDETQAITAADATSNRPAALAHNGSPDQPPTVATNSSAQLSSDGRSTFGTTGTPAGGPYSPQNSVDQIRFVQRVARAFRAADDQGGEIRLRLSPPELGSLKVEVALRNGVMTAKLEAETTSARNLLLNNLPALRERLADQNIKIERFDVDLRQDGAGGGSTNPPPDFTGSRRGPMPQNAIANRAVGEIESAPQPLVQPTRVDGRINILI